MQIENTERAPDSEIAICYTLSTPAIFYIHQDLDLCKVEALLTY